MAKIDDIQKLVETFRLERIIYVVLTTLSAVALIGIGLYLVIVQQQFESFLALLVPTGTLTMCIFRLLKMWDDALKFINNQKMNEKNED